MTDRFSPFDVWNAHMKSLKNRDFSQDEPVGTPDYVARSVLYGVPLVLGILSFVLDLKIAEPGGLLEVCGILLGAFLVGFSQVASWREKFTARLAAQNAAGETDDAELHHRYSLDEAVAHILLSMYAVIFLIITILIGTNLADEDGQLHEVPAAFTVYFGALLLILVIMIVPKLYTAYAVVNQVDDEMSGLAS